MDLKSEMGEVAAPDSRIEAGDRARETAPRRPTIGVFAAR